LEGRTPAHRVKAGPTPRPIPPNPPPELDAEGCEAWRDAVTNLDQLGLLSEADSGILIAYCDAVSIWRRAKRKLEAGGLTTVTPNGYEVQSPYLSIANRAASNMARHAAELGLTPIARLRLGREARRPADADDPFGGTLIETAAQLPGRK
jgi:P27 family predicted phage terminase small subunit